MLADRTEKGAVVETNESSTDLRLLVLVLKNEPSPALTHHQGRKLLELGRKYDVKQLGPWLILHILWHTTTKPIQMLGIAALMDDADLVRRVLILGSNTLPALNEWKEEQYGEVGFKYSAVILRAATKNWTAGNCCSTIYSHTSDCPKKWFWVKCNSWSTIADRFCEAYEEVKTFQHCTTAHASTDQMLLL
jgi:hypothetical protein